MIPVKFGSIWHNSYRGEDENVKYIRQIKIKKSGTRLMQMAVINCLLNLYTRSINIFNTFDEKLSSKS